jgi:hypothetical protein
LIILLLLVVEVVVKVEREPEVFERVLDYQ